MQYNTIVIGLFAGKENAFLIQNAFPVIEKYFDHIHTIQEQPVTIHKKLDKLLVENLNDEITLMKNIVSGYLVNLILKCQYF